MSSNRFFFRCASCFFRFSADVEGLRAPQVGACVVCGASWVRCLGATKGVAVELSLECAGELFRQERPCVTLLQRDFLALDPATVGPVDAVAMNPPFTMRSDIRHILHALRFLRPGGTLAALCMDTAQRETALRGMAKTWRHIPAGTFSKEGTGVGCVLLSIEKGGGA